MTTWLVWKKAKAKHIKHIRRYVEFLQFFFQNDFLLMSRHPHFWVKHLDHASPCMLLCCIYRWSHRGGTQPVETWGLEQAAAVLCERLSVSLSVRITVRIRLISSITVFLGPCLLYLSIDKVLWRNSILVQFQSVELVRKCVILLTSHKGLSVWFGQ